MGRPTTEQFALPPAFERMMGDFPSSATNTPTSKRWFAFDRKEQAQVQGDRRAGHARRDTVVDRHARDVDVVRRAAEVAAAAIGCAHVGGKRLTVGGQGRHPADQREQEAGPQRPGHPVVVSA